MDSLRDPHTMREVHGLREFHQLVFFWMELGGQRLENLERPSWQNYLISLGVTAVRAAAAIEVLAMAGRAEGMQCIVRQIIEIITRFVHLIESKDSGYRAELKRDQDQRSKIKKFGGRCSRPWMGELSSENFPGVDPTPPAEYKPIASPDAGVGIGLRAEYQYLCLITHNHLTAIYAKANTHLRGSQMDSTEPDPPALVERYLHITVDAMQIGCTKFFLDRELLSATDDVRDGLLDRLNKLTDAFKSACPER